MNITEISNSSIVTLNYYYTDPAFLDAVAIINNLVFCEVIGLFGIAANILNMINFKRQGFQDGVNVTLFTLSLCDAGALVAHQFSNLLFSPWLGEYDLFMAKRSLFMNIFYFNGYFVRVSGLLAAYMTFERCLCVVWPLKVKGVLTASTALAVNIAITSVSCLYFFPPYFIVTIDWVFLPNLNRTILMEHYSSNRHSVMTVFYFVADLFVPYATILILLLCTIAIITKLRSKLRWRQSKASSGGFNSGAVTAKERKVVRMLVTISVIFIVCLLPLSTLNVAMGLVAGLKVDGIYFYIYQVCYSFTSLLESIHCSITIIVYYKMSTRYRQVFWEMFRALTRTNIVKLKLH